MRVSMARGAAALALAASFGFVGSVASATETDDQEFVTAATQSSLAEIALAKVAEERSAIPEVKSFAREMIDDHTKLNLELKALAEKSGLTVPTEPSDDQKNTTERLSKLYGTDFDHEYVKVNVDEHKKAVALMRDEGNNTHDVTLRLFAQKTLTLFEHHLAQAEKLVGKVPAATPR